MEDRCEAEPGGGWDHNTHYHRLVLRALGRGREHVLDVGCGIGSFAAELSRHAAYVDAIDADPDVIEAAVAETSPSNVSFRAGDFRTYEFGDATYDAVTALASLHHMDLDHGLARMRSLLRPGGRLVVLGCYREAGAVDLAWSLAALPINLAMLRLRGPKSDPAPTAAPPMTLPEIREEARRQLPGVRIRRLLFWRYLLTWDRPTVG